MQWWNDGDLETEFEQRLDKLLTDVSPEQRVSGLPGPYRDDRRFGDYNRRNAKRRLLGDVLTDRPSTAAAHADRVLAAIVCDEDVAYNKQLLVPVLQAVGQRTVQRYLVSVVEHEPAHKKVCAVRAWYWSQFTLESDLVDADQAAGEKMSELPSRYRNACLAAFVTCEHTPTREWLSRGFLLVDSYFPPHLHHLVAQARALAQADPDRYKDLLAKEDGGTTVPQIGSNDA